jgi:DnaJ-class molecular chaperone
MDFYKVLDIRKNASIKTIKKAYHEKALKYHPDKNPKADIHKFHEIQTAYEILMDEEKRHKYDNLDNDDSINISMIFTKLISKIDSLAAFNKIKCQFTNILSNPKNIINITKLISKDNISFDDILDILNNLKTNNLLSTETDTNYIDTLDNINGSEYCQEVEKCNLDIKLTVNTNMKDIYNDKSQEIIYMRKNNGKDIKESVLVPLIGDQVIFEKLGDKKDKICGDLIIDINITNNMKYKKRNHDLIIRFEISLYQLFNGLVFSFIHLDDKEITIKIEDCFKYNFDGEKFKYIIKEKGILDTDGKRGNLIIQFVLIKDSHFDEKLLRFFG